MAQHNTSTESAKHDIEEIKKEMEALAKRLSSLTGKSADVLSEQMDNLAQTMNSFKQAGKKQSKELLGEIETSTREHPLRNLGYALGIGFLISLIVK